MGFTCSTPSRGNLSQISTLGTIRCGFKVTVYQTVIGLEIRSPVLYN
jgi:hypothetical protein